MKKKRIYTIPLSATTAMSALQILCASGKGWAEMDSYEENSGGGFSQVF
jgi:hypothetical protein